MDKFPKSGRGGLNGYVRGALLALNALPMKDVMYRLSTVEKLKPGRKT